MLSLKKARILCFCIILSAVLGSAVQVAGYDIGAYYFPGWESVTGRWQDLKGVAGSRSPGKSWPDREPLLGFYPEEELWVAEKHIDWASSYGISFFAYDWYWDGSKPYLNHAIENFSKAKNRQKLKFCLLWANHFPMPTNSEQFTSMVDFWLQNYLADPQYYRIDDKPVVIIFAPDMLRDNAAKFGKTTLELLELARAKAKAKGLKGIYFVGASPANSYWTKSFLPSSGYDAITAYNYHSKGFAGEFTGQEPPAENYAELAQGYKSQWDWMMSNASLPYLVPLTAGWDKRPWGSNTAHDNCLSTPQSFKAMLANAKAVMDSNPAKTKGVGIVCAWNEFGEGSYIEPTKKWKFKYLQAIKDIFTK